MASPRQIKIVDAGTGASGASTFAGTFDNPVLAGSTLLALVVCNSAHSLSSIADNVNAGNWPAAIDRLTDLNAASLTDISLCCKQNTLAGTPTVTATYSANSTFRAMVLVECDGVLAASLDKHIAQIQASPGTGTDAVTSGNTAALTQLSNLIIAICMDTSGSAGPPAAGTGYSGPGGVGWAWDIGFNTVRVESKTVSSTAAVAGTFTATDGATQRFSTFVVALMANAADPSFAWPSYQRGNRSVGPMVLRQGPPRPMLPNDQAPATNVEFVYPAYPTAAQLRMVGPTGLRIGVQHPRLPNDQAAATNTLFLFPVYPPPTPLRMTGPMALRLAVQHPPLPNDQAPATNIEFVFPVYPASSRLRMVGPTALRTGVQHPMLPLDAPASGGDVTVAISGVASTGSPGTLTPNIDTSLSGNQATGSVGTVVATPQLALTGNQAAGQIGSVSPAAAAPLAGVQAAGSAGTLGPAADTGISGVGATGAAGSVGAAPTIGLGGVGAGGQVGSLSPAASGGLSGVEGTGQAGTPTPNISVALTGVQAVGQVGTLTPHQPGSAGISGVAGTGAAGTVGVDITVAISGVEAVGHAGGVGVVVARSLTGVQAAGAAGDVAVGLGVSLLVVDFDFAAPPPGLHTEMTYDQASHTTMDAVASAARMTIDE